MNAGDINWDMVAALAQAFGFAGIVWGLLQNRRALQTQSALEFYRRYDDIAARMPNELRLPAYASTDWSQLPADIAVKMELALIDYFNLSSEEFALYRDGRLARDTWSVTQHEIRGKLIKPLWREDWQRVRREYTSDPAFVALIDRLIKESA